MSDITKSYGTLVFGPRAMEQYLPADAYASLMETVHEGQPINSELADVVADAMMRWALEHGATHYTHWFQPLTGITSEKHDSFLDPVGDGTAITKFSGKNLIQGESDASSFPNGGLRATFEARGYTAWDPTSYAFIKDEVLCVPTAFASYTTEALDKKTPLLRSMGVLSEQANRVLAFFGEDGHRVHTNVGGEQEFFLISEKDYAKREDLMLCGRTLFGTDPCKGQELEEHYYGAIRPTVNQFMKELDDELWALGIAAKTKHNEVAPCQHELACVYTEANRAIDENLIVMEKMKLLASHHGLVCLQHEKPFRGINGSGKHNNWSISTSEHNLLEPGDTPMENLRFLVFLTCVIAAVDDYQELLRMSVASAGNDHRLGGDEAPPAIVSIFLGDELGAIVDAIINDKPYKAAAEVRTDLGVDVLPSFLIDNTDRNRTSPFAFTGNKFEFRMPGSQVNLSDCNTILNTSMAKKCKDFADAMEGLEGAAFEEAALAYVKDSLTKHQRIIFNGNGYDAAWVEEATKRGLANHTNTAEALPALVYPESIALFEEMGVLSETELRSRYEVKLDIYNKTINIESNVMESMVRRMFIPAINAYATKIAKGITTVREAIPGADLTDQETVLERLLSGLHKVNLAHRKLNDMHAKALSMDNSQDRANCYANEVVPAMEEVRTEIDILERIVDHSYWPVPTYNDILFYT